MKMITIILFLILTILNKIVIGKQQSMYSANCNIILSSNTSSLTESTTKSSILLIDPCEVALFSYRNFSINGILEFSFNNKSDPYLCNNNNNNDIYLNLYHSVFNILKNTTNTINITDYSNSINIISNIINNIYNTVYNIIDKHFHNINSNKIVIVERGIIIITIIIIL